MFKRQKYLNGNKSYPIHYENDELVVYTHTDNKTEVFIRLKASARTISVTSYGAREIY
jgi:hypothetical protein